MHGEDNGASAVPAECSYRLSLVGEGVHVRKKPGVNQTLSLFAAIGANIVNADPREVAARLACYTQHNLLLGASWAINHWYNLCSFANETVYHPY